MLMNALLELTTVLKNALIRKVSLHALALVGLVFILMEEVVLVSCFSPLIVTIASMQHRILAKHIIAKVLYT